MQILNQVISIAPRRQRHGRLQIGRQLFILPALCLGLSVNAAEISPTVATLPPSNRDPAALEPLFQQLGSGSLTSRDDAEQTLLDCGPAILPFIIQAQRTAVGEAALRLRGVQRFLEDQAAATAVEASVITLAVENMPAREVLKRVFAESGNRITLRPDVETGVAGDRLLSLTFHRVPFWEVIDEVLDKAGLALTFFENETGLSIDAASNQIPAGTVAGIATPAATITLGLRQAVIAAGPLRIAVWQVEPIGVRSRANPPAGIRIVLRVAWEPRLHPRLMRLPLAGVVAEGHSGEAISPPQRIAVVEAVVPSKRKWLDLPLVLSQSSPRLDSLRLLRGTIGLWLEGREHDFEFSDLCSSDGFVTDISAQRPRTQRMAEATVCLSQFARQDDRLLATASITYDEPTEALASHHTWLTERPLQLLTAAGQPLAVVEQRVVSRSEQGLKTLTAFARPTADTVGQLLNLQGLRLRWKLPIAIHELPIDFAIRNVPLTDESQEHKTE